jgi:hypothetical protein
MLVEEARACNNKGYLSCIIKLDDVEKTVNDFKKVHPDVKHSISIDWDDETLYRIRFSWEPGTFGVPPPPPKKQPLKVENPLPSRPPPTRYGGPRW